jgi:hypothetical protein
MRGSRRKKILVGSLVGVAVLLAVAVVLAGLLRGHLPDGRPQEIVGSWVSGYFGGQMVLTLAEDGSFREELSGMGDLPDRAATGTWVVEDDHLLLTPFLGAHNSTEGWGYYTGTSKEISVRPNLWGGLQMEDIENLRFRRLES